jgi:hypothetical protein
MKQTTFIKEFWPAYQDSILGECGGPELTLDRGVEEIEKCTLSSRDTHTKLLDLIAIKSKATKSEAVKFDNGKPDWSLVPFESLEGMVRVLEFGAAKYSGWNWCDGGGFKWTRIIGSSLRHLFAFARGEDKDPESGLSHIYHVQCNMLFLAHYIGNKEKYNKDDRAAR